MVKTRIIESEPALILQEEEKHLVIADLHIGFEYTLSANKIFLIKIAIVVRVTYN